MFEPNPIAPIQIPMQESSNDDDELQEDNIDHDDDVDNNIDEKIRIDGLLESLYIPDDDDERDGIMVMNKMMIWKGITCIVLPKLNYMKEQIKLYYR